MAWTASELASVLALLGKIGGGLTVVYMVTGFVLLIVKKQLRRYTLSSGRRLIGKKVKVVRLVAPPNDGSAKLLDAEAEAKPITVWSDRMVRPGQRARITTLDERGYKIIPLARDRAVSARRVNATTGR